MVALLASVDPIKPRGSPPGFRTLPSRLCIYNFRHQSLELPTPASQLPASSHPPPPNRLMESWCRSDVTPQCLEGLIRRDLLCPLTATEEWRLLGNEDEPSPLKGMSCPSLTSMSGDSPYLLTSSFGGSWINIRWSCSTLLPMGSSTLRHSSPCVRGSWGLIPTLTYGGISSLSTF